MIIAHHRLLNLSGSLAVAFMLLAFALIPVAGWGQTPPPPPINPTVSLKILTSGTFPGTAVVQPPQEKSGEDGEEAIIYPPEAMRFAVEGTVKLKMLIGADGTIKQSETISNGGDARLLRASVEGLRKAGFAPGTVDGKPTEMWITVEVMFSMLNKSGPSAIKMPNENFASVVPPAKEFPKEYDMDMFVPDVIEPKYDQAELMRILEYPQVAKENGLEGRVIVSAQIDTEGTVLKVIIRMSSNKIFEAAAKKAVEQLTFSPASQNGQPIKMWKTFTIFFKLTPPPSDSTEVEGEESEEENDMGMESSTLQNRLQNPYRSSEPTSPAECAHVVGGSDLWRTSRSVRTSIQSAKC